MKLRFICSSQRRWLESDSEATRATWLRSYDQAAGLSDLNDKEKALNYAGSALEAAELLVFRHARQAEADITRFVDSAVLLCRWLIRSGQPRLACGVIGGCIARLEELMFSGTERGAVLAGCQRLLRVGDDGTPTQSIDCDPRAPVHSNSPGRWSLH